MGETRGIRGVPPGVEVSKSGRWDFIHTVRKRRGEQVRNLLHDGMTRSVGKGIPTETVGTSGGTGAGHKTCAQMIKYEKSREI